MIWAIKENERIKAIPKEKAICPMCKEEVISKCGSINIWHWSHKSKSECDFFKELETEWHRKWKSHFPQEQQEVVIKEHRADVQTTEGLVIEFQNSPISSEKIKDREIFYKKMIWVLNGESFFKNIIFKRKENFYTFRWKTPSKSWWGSTKPLYIDFSKRVERLRNTIKRYQEGKKHFSPIKELVYSGYEDYWGNYHESDYPPHWKITDYVEDTLKEIKRLEKEIFFLDNKLFLIKKVYPNIPCGGWGEFISKEDFLRRFK